MPDDQDGLAGAEERLEHKMTELGPLVERRRQAEAEGVDQAFAQDLRRRLLGDAPDRKRPRGKRLLVGHLAPRVWAVGLSAAAIVAAAVVVLLILLRPHASPAPALAAVPRPTRADLTRGYPSSGIMAGGGIGVASPLFSPAQVQSMPPYSGHLSLSTATIPSEPDTLPAYRLSGPPLTRSGFQRVAHHLGIQGRAHVIQGRWLVAADGGKMRINRKTGMVYSTPLHSLAMALDTGEIIYRDGRPGIGKYRVPAFTQSRANIAARAWIANAGLPAQDMVVQSVVPMSPVKRQPGTSPLAISYRWRQVRNPATPAGTIWVTPAGTITEVDMWPGIARKVQVGTVPGAVAWHDVASGKAPVAVLGSPDFPVSAGSGRATSVHVVQVRVPGKHGRVYLVPAYRFSGTVRLRGASYPWYALVPAATR